MSILTNIKKRGFKDIFSLRVFSYIESKLQKIFGVFTKEDDQIAYSEQILFKGIMCSECKEKGECIHCGCNFESISVSKSATCSQGKWGKVLNKKDWEDQKSKYMKGLKFGLVRE